MIKKVINHQEEFVAQSSSGGGSLDQQQADWNQSNSSAVDYIKNKPTIPDAQIQSDWNQSDNSEKDYIKNKPTLGTAASLDVATSGNASTTQVVKGDDTRLTDARTPVSHTHTKSEITDFPTLGTAAAKDSTNAVTENSTALVESGAVKTAIDAAVASAYHHAGTKTVSELVAALLVASNEGNVYNITDSGTTTSDFIEGAGKIIRAGDNVGIAKVDTDTYKFDLLSGFVDISDKADKVTSATSGDFAGLDSSGNLTDSGKKAADFAGADEMSAVVNVYGSKNLLWSDRIGVSETINGVTFTINADGSVSTSGVSNAVSTWFQYITAGAVGVNKFFNTLQPGITYKFSGVPAGADTKVNMVIWDASQQQPEIARIYAGEEKDFIKPTVPGAYTYINIGSDLVGADFNGLTFYPMVRDTRITDPTYVLYAKTNRELTTWTSAQNYTSYVVNTAISIVDINCLVIGDLVVLYGTIQMLATGLNQVVVTNLPKPLLKSSYTNLPYPATTWTDNLMSYGGNMYVDPYGNLVVNNNSTVNALFGFNLTYVRA